MAILTLSKELLYSSSAFGHQTYQRSIQPISEFLSQHNYIIYPYQKAVWFAFFLLFPQLIISTTKPQTKRGREGGDWVTRRPWRSFLKPNWKLVPNSRGTKSWKSRWSISKKNGVVGWNLSSFRERLQHKIRTQLTTSSKIWARV